MRIFLWMRLSVSLQSNQHLRLKIAGYSTYSGVQQKPMVFFSFSSQMGTRAMSVIPKNTKKDLVFEWIKIARLTKME